MYHKDLSNYIYVDEEVKNIINIGWLDKNHDFNKGATETIVLEKLRSIIIGNKNIDAHCNRVRSIEPCRLCANKNISLESESKKIHLGMTEIFIPAKNGKYYFSAPSLIIHYIEEHKYQPEKTFLQAVMSFNLDQTYIAQDIFDEIVN